MLVLSRRRGLAQAAHARAGPGGGFDADAIFREFSRSVGVASIQEYERDRLMEINERSKKRTTLQNMSSRLRSHLGELGCRGRHLESIWDLECIWDLGSIGEASRRYRGSIWEASGHLGSGRHLGSIHLRFSPLV